MFHSTLSRFLAVTAALFLSACAAQQQAPAPVVANSNAGGTVYNPYSPSPIDTNANPYGAAPYVPSVAPTVNNNAIYQPTAAPLPNVPTMPAGNGMVGNVNGVYIGNYSPVDVSASTHRVTTGDTIFNISKRYGISQDNLRTWNNLHDNTISLGQVLRVKSPTGSTPAVSVPAVPNKPKPTTSKKPTTPPNVASSSIIWTTPTQGNVVRSFGGDNKGIDISGTRGQPVVAAADGQVVYSGSNLRGYGNLIIIQHNPVYLTAYGHNEAPLLVKEGQFVRRGQQIARMGSSDSSSGVKLHFEVRENGTPVNPNRFVKF